MAVFGTLFGLDILDLIFLLIFSPWASDTDNRTTRLSKKKSWGSRMLKCCSVRSTVKAIRKTSSHCVYCSLLNHMFTFYVTERPRHVWNCHSGPGGTGETATKVARCNVLCCFPRNSCLSDLILIRFSFPQSKLKRRVEGPKGDLPVWRGAREGDAPRAPQVNQDRHHFSEPSELDNCVQWSWIHSSNKA